MKKLTSIIALFFLTITYTNAQVNINDLSNSWKVDLECTKESSKNALNDNSPESLEILGLLEHLLFILEGYNITYNTNNTFDYSIMNSKSKGKWTYNPTTKVLTHDTGDTYEQFTVLTLNKNSFTYTDASKIVYCLVPAR
jgi:hypothetical protein